MKRTLKPCPESPNCVSSLSADPSKHMSPLSFTISEEGVLKALREVVEARPRARVVEVADGYLRCEFTSFVFRFVDDVEFLIVPEEHLLHFRSASRVGGSDLGANRRRMTKLCRRLVARRDFAIASGK